MSNMYFPGRIRYKELFQNFYSFLDKKIWKNKKQYTFY